MRKTIWCIGSLLFSFCIMFFMKCNLVQANQIFEAEDFKIGSAVTNNNPEYMNYYKIRLLQKKTIKVECIGYSNNVYDIFRLYLYNSEFEEMDCDNPYGLSITNGARKESKKYTLNPGTYYIAVQDNDTNMLKYRLGITYVKTNTLWNYYGNSFANAKQLSMGDKLSGCIRGAYYDKAKQYFKVKLKEKSLLSLKFNYTQNDDLTVTLFSSSYNNIGQFKINSVASSKKIEKMLNKGTYYIVAYYGYNTNNSVDYGFSINRKCITPKLKLCKKGIKKLSGTTTPNAKVTVKVNKKNYSANADRSGLFRVSLKTKLKKGDKIVITVSKNGYLKSSEKTYKVK